MVGRRNRLTTDALREVKNTFSRFLSILVLSALAVAFLAGLRATAPDMQYTADNYYDRTRLMDGYVVSTLGLTEEDLEILAASEGIETVEGIWSVDAIAQNAIVSVRSMPEKLNLLEVTEGRLPERSDECVTERMLLVELGLNVGDRLDLVMGKDNGGDLECLSYTIVGVVVSPLYVGTDRGTSSLGSGSVDAFMYIPGENFNYDYYTMAYFTGDGFLSLDSYGEEYDRRLDALIDSLDGLADERAKLRYSSIVEDAQAEIDDAWAELADAQRELDEARADAEKELGDARTELSDARTELDDGWEDYYEGIDTYHQEIADGERKYLSGLSEYEDGREKYQSGVASYEDGLKKYEEGKKQYDAGWTQYQMGLVLYEENAARLDAGQAQLDAGKAAYDANLAMLDGGQAQLDQQKSLLDQNQADYDAGMAMLEQMNPASPGYAERKEELDRMGVALSAGRVLAVQKQAELDAGYSEARAAKAVLDETEAQLKSGYSLLPGAWSELQEAEAQLRSSQEQLSSAWAEIQSAKSQLADARSELSSARNQLDSAAREIEDGRKELEDARQELEDAAKELEDGEQELADGWAEYHDGVTDLEKGRADGQKELDDALTELEDGEKEYADGLAEYEDGEKDADEMIADAQAKLDDALAELNDAQAELDDLKECKWYVLGRNTNVGFEGYGQDSERVSNLATLFPVIFFLVAALACLTTMTRMVEEQRTQIGALKAMGFSRFAISKKYIGYALSASLIGGILGLVLGGTLIPGVIANAFNIMYNIPPLQFKRQTGMYVMSVLAAVVCTTGAGLWACLSTLVDTPANLMRPKAPKAGKRIFLEYIRPVWGRLSFTWKVTMRNLFRYQRRFWMTVIGIGGCTALIVTGFGLHDSIFAILNKQFDEISLYDAMVGLDMDASSEEFKEVEKYLEGSEYVERTLTTSQSMAEASTDGLAYDVYLFGVDDMEEFTQFIDLRHRLDDGVVTLPEDGVIITEKLSELLETEVGGVITLEKDDERVEAVVADIVNIMYSTMSMCRTGIMRSCSGRRRRKVRYWSNIMMMPERRSRSGYRRN